MKLPFRSGKEKTENRAAAETAESVPVGKVKIRSQELLLLILGVLLIAAPPFAVYLQTASLLSDATRQQSQLTSRLVAGAFEQWANQQIGIAEVLARDPRLAQLLMSNNARALEEKSDQLAYMFPDAIRVRLMQPGMDKEDLDANPPISYTALDMLLLAETREIPPPLEVHMSGTPQQHINLVRRILDPSGRRIAGLLMVSFPVQLLQELAAAEQTGGYAQLQQVAGDAALTLAGSGNAGLMVGKPDAESPVKDTGWKVAFWSADQASNGSTELLVMASIAAAVAAIILAALVTFVFRKFMAALRKDQATMLTIVKDMRDGRVKQGYPNELVELHDTIELMGRTANSGAARTPRPSVSAAAETAASVETGSNVVDGIGSDLLFDENALDIARVDGGEKTVSPEIFRAYDIRGIVGESLTADIAYEIGRATGSEAYFRGEQTIVVGRDGRLSSPELSEALIRGLKDTGRDVKDIGQVPTPVLYFAAQYLNSNSGVMVTGSHNPADYNGFKIVLGGETLAREAIQSLYRRIESSDLLTGEGTVEKVDVLPDYIERIKSDVQVMRPIKLVVDCGNGVAGAVAPKLLNALGCEAVELFCDVDGNFPNHHPDPGKPENLAALIQAVQEQGAELGIAFDGDGDRLGVVTARGDIVWPDRLMMLYAIDVLSRNPGAQIIYDVKCTRNLASTIVEHGGEALMWASGHSIVKEKMKETGALLAGEMSGHIFFKERWFGFDDGLYAAARLLEILGNDSRDTGEVFDGLPDSMNTPELNVPMAEGEPARYMERLLNGAHFDNANISTVDGMRVEFEDGWGLVRASNTTPSLVLRFEADHEIAMHRIQEEFRRVMLQADANLNLPF